MRHQCWSLVIVSTERGRQVGDEVLHHGLPRSRESPVYRRGHGESVFACASTLVRRGEYRAQTGIWRLLGFVSARTIKGRSSSSGCASDFFLVSSPSIKFFSCENSICGMRPVNYYAPGRDASRGSRGAWEMGELLIILDWRCLGWR